MDITYIGALTLVFGAGSVGPGDGGWTETYGSRRVGQVALSQELVRVEDRAGLSATVERWQALGTGENAPQDGHGATAYLLEGDYRFRNDISLTLAAGQIDHQAWVDAFGAWLGKVALEYRVMQRGRFSLHGAAEHWSSIESADDRGVEIYTLQISQRF